MFIGKTLSFLCISSSPPVNFIRKEWRHFPNFYSSVFQQLPFSYKISVLQDYLWLLFVTICNLISSATAAGWKVLWKSINQKPKHGTCREEKRGTKEYASAGHSEPTLPHTRVFFQLHSGLVAGFLNLMSVDSVTFLFRKMNNARCISFHMQDKLDASFHIFLLQQPITLRNTAANGRLELNPRSYRRHVHLSVTAEHRNRHKSAFSSPKQLKQTN